MNKPVSNQVRQRKAVRDALNRQQVFVSSKLFKTGEEPLYRVIVSNEAYKVRQHTLDRLLEGVAPADLGLEPLQGDAAE
jgi:hypothetical protein